MFISFFKVMFMKQFEIVPVSRKKIILLISSLSFKYKSVDKLSFSLMEAKMII